ncbi:MAG: biotin/lipoyl-binding protein [Acidobacteriia bacterium]|nr:biotin/lipoyl-binding protein [Terriglobia bacterium]
MKLRVWLDGVANDLELNPELAQNGWGFECGNEKGSVSVVEVEPGIYSILWEGSSFEAVVTLNGDQGVVKVAGAVVAVRIEDPREISGAVSSLVAAGRQHVTAPMPGRVVDLLVEEGQAVEAGQAIMVVEAMKMQNEMRAPLAGRVIRVLVRPGDAVAAGDVLATVESEEVCNG